jgi:catechol 2,3-dioxygenase
MSVSHLGHVELVVPDVQASVDFLTRLVGLNVSEIDGDTAYLRAWQDADHHTCVLREGHEAAFVHAGWRVAEKTDADALEQRLNELGIESHWVEGSVGHGDSLRFVTPAGLPYEVYWEAVRYEASPELASQFPSHPSKVPPVSAPPRRIDHIGVNVGPIEDEQAFNLETLGIKHRYFGSIGGHLAFSFFSSNALSHELAMVRNVRDTGAELHHLCYFLDSPADVYNAAVMLRDNGVRLQFGPVKHAPSGGTAIYFLEPGGHRIELSSTVMLCLAPDWEPQRWEGEIVETMGDMFLNGKGIQSDEYKIGTPAKPEVPAGV